MCWNAAPQTLANFRAGSTAVALRRIARFSLVMHGEHQYNVLRLLMPAFAVDNARFALEIEGAKPVLWKEYEPVARDFVGCVAGVDPGRLTHATCAQLDSRRSLMFWDALKQAVLLNRASRETQIFCADHVNKIIASQNQVEDGAIAAGMIETQLRGGTGPYGADLLRTYLGKIVYDALVKISPCRQQ